MTQSDQVSAIVRGLSEAGRKFLPTVTFGGWWRTGEDTPRGLVGPLTKAGVLEVVRWTDIGNQYRLTPLGLAVRQYLQDQTND